MITHAHDTHMGVTGGRWNTLATEAEVGAIRQGVTNPRHLVIVSPA